MAVSESTWDTTKGILNICFLILTGTFLTLYSKHYVEIKHKMASGLTLDMRLIMNTSIALVLAYFIRYIISTTFHVLLDTEGSGAVKFEKTMKDSLLIIGHSVFYLIMVLRLFLVFKKSKYALNRWTKVFLGSFWTVILVINIVYFVTFRKNEDNSNHSIFFFMLAVLDLIYGVILIVIFTQKLTEMGM